MSKQTVVVQFKASHGNGIKVDDKWLNAADKDDNLFADVEAGDKVELTLTSKGKVADLTIVEKGADKPAGNSSKGSFKKPAASGGSNWNDSQPGLIFRWARSHSFDFLKEALAQGAVTLPSAKADKLAAMEAFVDEYTIKFNKQALAVFKGEDAAAVVLGESSEASDE